MGVCQGMQKYYDCLRGGLGERNKEKKHPGARAGRYSCGGAKAQLQMVGLKPNYKRWG